MSAIKHAAGRVMAALNPQCDYTRACFLIGHMRCGSTALSAILVSRPDLSGYGEAHIAYADRAALGVLAINQWRRGAWNAQAGGLFDKVLHNRYDRDACAGFFSARALFMAREPLAAIRSVRQLFDGIASGEYATDEAAAAYYCERLAAMIALWPRFAPERRVALTYEALVAAPEAQLARISGALGFDPPLANRYRVKAASQARGAGDPTTAARYEQIVAMDRPAAARPPQAAPATLARAGALFDQFCTLIEEERA